MAETQKGSRYTVQGLLEAKVEEQGKEIAEMQLEIERLNNMYGDRHDKWKSQMLRAEAAESRLEAMEEVVEAVNWLMGCNGEFEKPDGAHP